MLGVRVNKNKQTNTTLTKLRSDFKMNVILYWIELFSIPTPNCLPGTKINSLVGKIVLSRTSGHLYSF